QEVRTWRKRGYPLESQGRCSSRASAAGDGGHGRFRKRRHTLAVTATGGVTSSSSGCHRGGLAIWRSFAPARSYAKASSSGSTGASAKLLRQDGAVAPRGAASGSLPRVVGAYASVVGCRG